MNKGILNSLEPEFAKVFEKSNADILDKLRNKTFITKVVVGKQLGVSEDFSPIIELNLSLNLEGLQDYIAMFGNENIANKLGKELSAVLLSDV
jgi:hypothetical protein